MARLAISKGFLADYVKLDKDVQRAVDQAVATFARDSQPGLHLEMPPHVNDDRLRILPVGTLWRGVVLTDGDASPDGTYSLVTVLPQDQADAYVTSYQSSVNRALETLEARDAEVSGQLQRTPEGEQLPADVSDPGLTRPAVAAQVLPIVQLMAPEADLETRETGLPETRQNQLHPLPDGTTVDEAPAGLAHATEVPEQRKRRLGRPHPLAAWRRFRARTSAT